MVIYAKRDALPVVSCYHFETGAVHEVPLPEQFCTIGAGVNLVSIRDLMRTLVMKFVNNSTKRNVYLTLFAR